MLSDFSKRSRHYLPEFFMICVISMFAVKTEMIKVCIAIFCDMFLLFCCLTGYLATFFASVSQLYLHVSSLSVKAKVFFMFLSMYRLSAKPRGMPYKCKNVITPNQQLSFAKLLVQFLIAWKFQDWIKTRREKGRVPLMKVWTTGVLRLKLSFEFLGNFLNRVSNCQTRIRTQSFCVKPF